MKTTLTVLTALILCMAFGHAMPGTGAPVQDAEKKEGKVGTITGTITSKPSKYATGAVIYLKEVKGKFKADNPVTMDQKNLTFIPHVLPVLAGTEVKFLNSDNVLHNVFSPDGEKFDLGSWPQGKSKAFKFEKTGVYSILCNVHPEMEGYIVVLQNPHFAVSGEKGEYRIKDVPPGEYTLVVWSERLPSREQTIKVEAEKTVEADFKLSRRR